jgi:hypothetical protein
MAGSNVGAIIFRRIEANASICTLVYFNEERQNNIYKIMLHIYRFYVVVPELSFSKDLQPGYNDS